MQSKEKKQSVGQIFANSRKCEILPVFYQPFRFILMVLGLSTYLKAVWTYHYACQDDLTHFKGWSCFCSFLGLFASFLHAQLILTSVGQSQRELLCLGQTAGLSRLYSPHFTPLRNYWNITTTQNVLRKANRPTWDCYFSSFVYISW